ncbi:hypothetical protein SALBM135S_00770 [Streptomyces alboniger]
MARDNWYLTSVQAGFEPWRNGTGLSVKSFSSSVHLGAARPGTRSGSDALRGFEETR